MKLIVATLLTTLLTLSGGLYAQSIKMRLANKELDNFRHSNAIKIYEEILVKHPNSTEAKIKLAECYVKIKDVAKALPLYEDLANDSVPSPLNFRHYAMMLAANGYYPEAAVWYRKYAEAVPDDSYAGLVAKSYDNMDQFFTKAKSTYVQFVPTINSWESDFSPVYFKEGLLFLSNRQQRDVIRTVYPTDNTSYLQYYYASDTATIEQDLLKPFTEYTLNKSKDDHSDITVLTSNDSNIPAPYGKIYSYDSVRYHDTGSTAVGMITNNLNHKYHEGPASFTCGQDTMFITKSAGYSSREAERPSSRFGIFMSYRIGEDFWTAPVPVPFNIDGYSTGHPALNADNTVLYFASDRSGGKGGVDIYMVTYTHGKFSDPINVEEVNTTGDEMFPFVDVFGDLHFASDGRPGLGGLDLFRADIEDGKIVKVENAGHPFNTRFDDFGIVWNADANKGFFTSNRKRGFTDDDIYSFKRLCREVTVHVFDSVTNESLDSAYVETDDFKGYTDVRGNIDVCIKPGVHPFKAGKDKYGSEDILSKGSRVEIGLKPVNVKIAGRIYSKEDNRSVEGVRVILTNQETHSTKEVLTSTDGKYEFPLGFDQNYTVTVAKQSCGTHSISRTTVGLSETTILKGDMDILCAGDIVRLDNIYYDYNKYNIRADAATELEKLIIVLNQYPDMRVELRSHTDSRGTTKFNMNLSAKRAQAVLDYCADHGILPSRMRASGYGESVPLNKCIDGVECSEDEFQLNRRTEFKVLSFN